MTIRARDLHRQWMQDSGYKRAYEVLGKEFELAAAMISARARAGLTQAQLAKRMGATQPFVARLESGRTRPSTRTLERFAQATGTHLRISFEPRRAAR
jgi:transcriptional regulator with XRE-family HTH domain